MSVWVVLSFRNVTYTNQKVRTAKIMIVVVWIALDPTLFFMHLILVSLCTVYQLVWRLEIVESGMMPKWRFVCFDHAESLRSLKEWYRVRL